MPFLLPTEAAAAEEHQQRPRPRSASNRQSFHSRNSVHTHVTEYQEGKSPYINPNHYSARPETYHRKSFTSSFTPQTLSPSTPTTGANAGFHSQFPSDATSTESAHHRRGPTGTAERGLDYHALHSRMHTAEEKRLEEDDNKERYWRRWGCYLSERQWVSRIHIRSVFEKTSDWLSPIKGNRT